MGFWKNVRLVLGKLWNLAKGALLVFIKILHAKITRVQIYYCLVQGQFGQKVRLGLRESRVGFRSKNMHKNMLIKIAQNVVNRSRLK